MWHCKSLVISMSRHTLFHTHKKSLTDYLAPKYLDANSLNSVHLWGTFSRPVVFECFFLLHLQVERLWMLRTCNRSWGLKILTEFLWTQVLISYFHLRIHSLSCWSSLRSRPNLLFKVSVISISQISNAVASSLSDNKPFCLLVRRVWWCRIL